MRVLVVEDDAPLAEVLRRGLTEDGYATDVVGKLSDARHAVTVNDYDLLVLDRGLPDGDGRSLCADRRKRSRRSCATGRSRWTRPPDGCPAPRSRFR